MVHDPTPLPTYPPLCLSGYWYVLINALHAGKKDEEYRGHLGSFGVTGELALRPIASLSGGQKSRLAFALMVMPR